MFGPGVNRLRNLFFSCDFTSSHFSRGDSGGITCLTLLVERSYFSKVETHVAKYGDP